MKLKDMQAKETTKLWSVLWHPEDWTEPSIEILPDGKEVHTPAAALLFVVADTEEAARKVTGLDPADILLVQPTGYSGVIVA